VLCSGASALEQRLVLLLPPQQHENVGPQPPRQRTNPFLFFLFLSQHGIFAIFAEARRRTGTFAVSLCTLAIMAIHVSAKRTFAHLLP
jgi:hypothetical protein